MQHWLLCAFLLESLVASDFCPVLVTQSHSGKAYTSRETNRSQWPCGRSRFESHPARNLLCQKESLAFSTRTAKLLLLHFQ